MKLSSAGFHNVLRVCHFCAKYFSVILIKAETIGAGETPCLCVQWSFAFFKNISSHMRIYSIYKFVRPVSDLFYCEATLQAWDVPLCAGEIMRWYQHNHCPAHYPSSVGQSLNEKFLNRLFDHNGTIAWATRLPDLASGDLFPLLNYFLFILVVFLLLPALCSCNFS